MYVDADPHTHSGAVARSTSLGVAGCSETKGFLHKSPALCRRTRASEVDDLPSRLLQRAMAAREALQTLTALLCCWCRSVEREVPWNSSAAVESLRLELSCARVEASVFRGSRGTPVFYLRARYTFRNFSILREGNSTVLWEFSFLLLCLSHHVSLSSLVPDLTHLHTHAHMTF